MNGSWPWYAADWGRDKLKHRQGDMQAGQGRAGQASLAAVEGSYLTALASLQPAKLDQA